LTGTYLNAFSQSYGEKAMELCKEVFLGDISESDSREKLMMASWHGGMSIAYSQVGVAHAMSYGLSYLLGVKHGLGNCLVFQHLGEFYPEGVAIFDQMIQKHGIALPQGICADLTQNDFDVMINVSLGLEALWENALGKDWKKIMTPARLQALYQKI
ncbi:MAG: alcohol dehydrogenase, partial [Flavobacteriia bacterium]